MLVHISQAAPDVTEITPQNDLLAALTQGMTYVSDDPPIESPTMPILLSVQKWLHSESLTLTIRPINS